MSRASKAVELFTAVALSTTTFIGTTAITEGLEGPIMDAYDEATVGYSLPREQQLGGNMLAGGAAAALALYMMLRNRQRRNGVNSGANNRDNDQPIPPTPSGGFNGAGLNANAGPSPDSGEEKVLIGYHEEAPFVWTKDDKGNVRDRTEELIPASHRLENAQEQQARQQREHDSAEQSMRQDMSDKERRRYDAMRTTASDERTPEGERHNAKAHADAKLEKYIKTMKAKGSQRNRRGQDRGMGMSR